MTLDTTTRQAIRHTFHCLVGCGTGEIIGMLIAASLGWHRPERLAIAILLAFAFGYSLTYRGVRKHTTSTLEAIKITGATDTISIATMELIDSTLEFIIPNALIVTATSFRFWWGLAVSLSLAFVVTVPVNRYMIRKNPAVHHH
jgi:ABC-type nitrate/sulfonate/bicarbonate transport system permease component